MVIRPPSLPNKLAPPLLQAVMDELSPYGHGTPLMLPTLLAAVAFSTAGKMHSRTPDGRIYDHTIYCMVISPSGTGKTFFLDTLFRDPVNAAIAQYNSEGKREIAQLQVARSIWILRVKSVQNGLKKATDPEKSETLEKELVELMLNEPPKVRLLDHILVTDASCKAVITEILYEYPYAGWIATEAMSTLGDMRSGDENRLAEVWDGKRLTWVRSKQAPKQIDPHLTLLWTIQNERWQAYDSSPRGKRLRGSGAAARMLFTYMPEDTIADSGTIGPATQQFCELIQAHLVDSITHSRTNWDNLPTIDFSRDAASCLRSIQFRYNSMKRDDRYKDHSDFVGRMLDHVCRVASLLHAIDTDAGEIKLEHVERAEAIIDYHFDVFCYLYPKIDNRPLHQTDAETLYDWLRGHIKLLDKHRRHVEQELGMSNGRMNKAVSELFRLNLVRFDNAGESGLILKRDASWVARCLSHQTLAQSRFLDRY